MRNVSLAIVGVAVVLSACGSSEGALRTIPGVDGEGAGERAATSVDSEEAALSSAELDLLDSLGINVPSEVNEIGVGDVVVTLTATGTEIEMEGMAIQLQSDDRFYDNTLVYAWSGLDVDAGTAEYLLWFRAAALVEAGSNPLDQLSNAMLPSWVLFSDEAGDTTYYNEDGTLTIGAVSLDSTTEVECTDTSFQFEAVATCTTGTIEGDIDMTALGYSGLGAAYVGAPDRGVSTGTLDLEVTFDLPVQRISFER